MSMCKSVFVLHRGVSVSMFELLVDDLFVDLSSLKATGDALRCLVLLNKNCCKY